MSVHCGIICLLSNASPPSCDSTSVTVTERLFWFLFPQTVALFFLPAAMRPAGPPVSHREPLRGAASAETPFPAAGNYGNSGGCCSSPSLRVPSIIKYENTKNLLRIRVSKMQRQQSLSFQIVEPFFKGRHILVALLERHQCDWQDQFQRLLKQKTIFESRLRNTNSGDRWLKCYRILEYPSKKSTMDTRRLWKNFLRD